MKNIKRVLLPLLCGLVFVSCSSVPKDETGKLVGETPLYYMTVETLDGVDSLVKVKFSISSEIVDSLKVSETAIKKICEESTSYADWDVNHKRTFRFKEKGYNMMSFDNETGNILVWVYGIAANGFGVEGDITTHIEFDTTGEMKRGEYDLPLISTY